MSYISGLWCGGKSTQPVSDSETLLSKADSAFLPFMCVHVAAVISQPTTTPSPLHSIPSFSLSLSRHLYLCSTAPAHSSLRWPGRHALSSLFSPWLLAPLQHPSVPLACSPPPSTHPPPLAYVSPSGARWPAWFPGCCCCCWSSGAVCYDATALPLCTSPPPASHSPLLDNRHLVLQEKATQDSKGGRQRERERERARGRELFIQLLHFSVDLTPLLSCAAGAQRSAEKDWSGGGERAPWRNFILLSLRFHPLFIPGTECRGAEKRRGRDWEQDLRLSCTAQCPALLKRHTRQTHTHICVDWSDQTGYRRQTHSNTDRQTDRLGVMASVDSSGSSVSGRLRSGDLLHAGLAVALLLGELSYSLCLQLPCNPSLLHYISTFHQNVVLLSSAYTPACDWVNPFSFSIHSNLFPCHLNLPSLTCFFFFFFFFSPIVSVFQHSSERVVHSCHTKSIPFFFFFKCLNNSPH